MGSINELAAKVAQEQGGYFIARDAVALGVKNHVKKGWWQTALLLLGTPLAMYGIDWVVKKLMGTPDPFSAEWTSKIVKSLASDPRFRDYLSNVIALTMAKSMGGMGGMGAMGGMGTMGAVDPTMLAMLGGGGDVSSLLSAMGDMSGVESGMPSAEPAYPVDQGSTGQQLTVPRTVSRIKLL